MLGTVVGLSDSISAARSSMNATSAPSQSKRPPEKGSFPLDHYGECKPFMKVCAVKAAGSMNELRLTENAELVGPQEFLQCMKEHQSQHIQCKHLSKAYLKCRMDNNLMKEEPLDHLGFHEKGMVQTKRVESLEGRKEGEGFIAGLGVKKKRYEDKQ
ncbi:TPA: hypothetical protein N0F65_011560 [Lagenidium giganteum]|uniref:CHCH domain-containing protein n=1 Tax=Lagenidium giganteum TaxID=4803 RepID=A0AAV2YNS0_9STRA|nr:TPA: hypothetical protein N0F65_011560 [Lagenidium giganteum]